MKTDTKVLEAYINFLKQLQDSLYKDPTTVWRDDYLKEIRRVKRHIKNLKNEKGIRI
jgi:hypothetical protein